jgi:hypothetical protein
VKEVIYTSSLCDVMIQNSMNSVLSKPSLEAILSVILIIKPKCSQNKHREIRRMLQQKIKGMSKEPIEQFIA